MTSNTAQSVCDGVDGESEGKEERRGEFMRRSGDGILIYRLPRREINFVSKM